MKKAEHGEWPKALRDKPEIDDSLASIWRCFWALHNSRSAGFDANPLAASEVLTVLDLFGFEDIEEKQRAFELIKAMDAAYLQKRNERRGDEKRSLPGSNR